MLLAEAIAEKEYIKESIRDLQNYITALSIEGDQDSISKYIEELDELYKRYQKFSISIGRTKNSTVIKLNDTELNLSDAYIIYESMEYKLSVYKSILDKSFECESVYPKVLLTELEKARLDAKTIRTEIDYALWNVETS